MTAIWLIEKNKSPTWPLASVLMSNFAVRTIASTSSCAKIVTISDEQDLPVLIVVNDETLGNESEALTFVQALRGRGGSIKVIVSDNASDTWRRLAASYFEIVAFNPNNSLDFFQKIVDVLVSNSVSTMLRADRAQAHEYKLQRGQIGDIQFDLLTGSLKIAEQRGDDLSPKEARIFDVLAGSANQCVSRSLLAISVWGDISVSERTLDTHISRLRRKISSSSECVIESVYGKGYSLVIQL